MDSKSDQIRILNDYLRTTFTGGRIVVTASIAELDRQRKARVLLAVRKFNKFDADNDPHHEHDVAFFEVDGEHYFFKVDLYEEPDVKSANGERVVTRVLTIMLAEEY
jgi:hypothetical protein